MSAPIDSSNYKALDWNRMIDLVMVEARTELAKTQLEKFQDPENWAPNLASARQMQLETQEIMPLLDRDALWGPLTDLTDPTQTLDRLSKGSVLELAEFVVLRQWLYAVDSWCQIPRDDLRSERLKKAISLLPDPSHSLRIVEKILTPEGELSEKASPKLGTLNAEIRHLKREISDQLGNVLKFYSQKGYLQEDFTDVRDGRFVIPVRISHQNEVEGIIHEASVSRQTVFIEPREVALLNNRLRQKQNDLLQEIFTILESTSKLLRPLAPEIQASVEIVCHWDTVQAKARLGRKYSGKTILVQEDRAFSLRQTAHPLLWWSLPQESIIRNDIEFMPPTRTLLLTGPNTGGKTVLLKTLGLAGICARTGFPFPATDTPIVPFFDSFFADLGDPQSIEHHLSSFSGHVIRFRDILTHLTDLSLVLIDELNSATDPEEGAAFGRAVLETLMAKNAMIVTTTHDPHIKVMSATDSRILSGGMEFDENSRSPTYRIAIGIPGRSRALETAERLGIPKSVIDLARTYLSAEHREFERLLSKLESDTMEIARSKKEAVALRLEAERLKKEWTERTQTSLQDLVDRTRQRLRRTLELAQDEVRTSVRRLEEAKSHRDLDKTRSLLNQAISRANQEIETALQEEAPEVSVSIEVEEKAPTLKVEVGATVRIPKWKNTGTVLEVNPTKVKVSIGKMQMTLPIGEVEVIAPPKAAAPMPKISGASISESVPSEVDLRGIRFEEAMGQLEKYLDMAFRNGNLLEVVVIHGLGTGALREGTLKLLGKLPYIKTFRSAEGSRGGTGATIVEFDRD